MKKFFIAVTFSLTAVSVWADNTSPINALELLKKVADSSKVANYSGTFIYQHGGRVETSRIVHFVNPEGGIFERLETLDGPPRELIRANDHVTWYLPESKTVLIERHNLRQLPVMLPKNLADLDNYYKVSIQNTDRISELECKWVTALPKDKLRFGRRFCAESETGLPIRAQIINERNQLIESFGFSQLTIGGAFNREKVNSTYAVRAKTQKWRVDESALNIRDQAADTGWVLKSPPLGFRKTMEVRRSIIGRGSSVAHLVYSDGLAAISVFVETMADGTMPNRLTNQGAVHIYKRMAGQYKVTTLGEAPAATVMLIANSLELKKTNQK
jgi:sigma-E factor negative regulatory protein RseB